MMRDFIGYTFPVRKKRKDDMKKRIFSKLIVVFCILEMALMQVWSMRIADTNQFLVTGLLTANHAVFGGELLLLCIKRIFSSKNEEGHEWKE